MELKIHVSLDKHKYIDVEIPIKDTWLCCDQAQVMRDGMDKIIEMIKECTGSVTHEGE